jgi:TetR/AcrR family tetracycline transcriptional repressor
VDTVARPPLSQAMVVAAALALLDDFGIDGLTVRRLAAELGVKSPALYWHFRNKQELIDGMATAIVLAAGMGSPADGETWQDWLVRRAHSYRDELLARRDGARVVAAARSLGPQVLNAFDDELASMITFGFTPLQAQRTIAVVSHFTTGFVLEEQSAQFQDGPNDAATIAGLTATLARGEESPFLLGLKDGGSQLSTGTFDHGIRVIVAGTAAILSV